MVARFGEKVIFKNGPIPASFGLFSSFPHDKSKLIDKIVDGVLGTQTRGGRMEGADNSTELWRHPNLLKKLLGGQAMTRDILKCTTDVYIDCVNGEYYVTVDGMIAVWCRSPV